MEQIKDIRKQIARDLKLSSPENRACWRSRSQIQRRKLGIKALLIEIKVPVEWVDETYRRRRRKGTDERLHAQNMGVWKELSDVAPAWSVWAFKPSQRPSRRSSRLQ